MDAARSPRRLRGHSSTATCCIASRDRPSIVCTAGEDGCVCLFDLRCKDVQLVIKLGFDAISSLCFKQGLLYEDGDSQCNNSGDLYPLCSTSSSSFAPCHALGVATVPLSTWHRLLGHPGSSRNENMIYAASGSEIKCVDLQMPTFEKPMESYAYNVEEINQISCNSKSSFLAAADDSGVVKIIDIQQCRPFKTLRSGHANICSSVQFLPWKPWTVVSGGLDSKMIMWDFSKGRPFLVAHFGNMENGGTPGQCYNPAFIHAIAVPEMDMLSKVGKACAVARGDGVVSLVNLESELDAIKSKPATKGRKNFETKSKCTTAGADAGNLNQNVGKWLHLDHGLGGHTAAASCVTFSSFGERGKFIISGGNDKAVKVWDWSRSVDDTLTCVGTDVAFSISVQKKVNGVCTTPADSENLVVCDTSKVVKVYTIS